MQLFCSISTIIFTFQALVVTKIFRILSTIYLVVIVIYCDNKKTIIFVKNLAQYIRTKHINIQIQFVCKKIANNQIKLKYIFIKKQVVDKLIKALFRNMFEIFCYALKLI